MSNSYFLTADSYLLRRRQGWSVRNAISRFNQTDFEDTKAKHGAARKITSAAKRHAIEIDPADAVARAAKR